MTVMDELENVGGIIVKRDSTPYLRQRMGLGDKEVAFIVDKTEELLRNKPNDLDEEKSKLYKELEIAHLMYSTRTNYNYGIGRMRKIIRQLLGE